MSSHCSWSAGALSRSSAGMMCVGCLPPTACTAPPRPWMTKWRPGTAAARRRRCCSKKTKPSSSTWVTIRPIWSAWAATRPAGRRAGSTSRQMLPSGSPVFGRERRQAPAHDFLDRRLEPRRPRGRHRLRSRIDVDSAPDRPPFPAHGRRRRDDCTCTRGTRDVRDEQGICIVSLRTALRPHAALVTYENTLATEGVVMDRTTAQVDAEHQGRAVHRHRFPRGRHPGHRLGEGSRPRSATCTRRCASGDRSPTPP